MSFKCLSSFNVNKQLRILSQSQKEILLTPDNLTEDSLNIVTLAPLFPFNGQPFFPSTHKIWKIFDGNVDTATAAYLSNDNVIKEDPNDPFSDTIASFIDFHYNFQKQVQISRVEIVSKDTSHHRSDKLELYVSDDPSAFPIVPIFSTTY